VVRFSSDPFAAKLVLSAPWRSLLDRDGAGWADDGSNRQIEESSGANKSRISLGGRAKGAIFLYLEELCESQRI
jgi:hypothetical protein